MVYERINALCKKRGISIDALEKKAGLGHGTIGGWRTASPTLEKLQAVADALDVKVVTLLKQVNKEKE